MQLNHRGNEAMPVILAWLQGLNQSGAARGNATGTKKGSNRTSRLGFNTSSPYQFQAIFP